ncbi:MAG: glycosyltransferase family 4 protein [Ignavibacteriaceae bacterium]|nr:glycosyltransferase family 4 protein [Ignavibacteriaceae bacterium]
MKKKKLAYFGVNYFPSKGGVSRTTENLITHLKDEFDITIYCFKDKRAGNHMPGVKAVQFRLLPVKGIGVFLFFLECYFHMMIFGNYDIVHVRKIESSIFIPLLKLKYKNILATSHESPYLRDKWGRVAKLYFRINEKIFVRSTAKLTVISAPLSKYYKAMYNRDVLYVPNGIEPVKVFKETEADLIFKKYNIKTPFVTFAARRIMSTKGCHTMLKAFQDLKYSNDIVIMGDTGHAPAYRNKLDKLSEGLKVHFTGYMEDKSIFLEIIRRSEVFIFPSETEGMSIALLEVAALGVPIIASDIPENTEIFNDDELIFFKNGDFRDLADKIILVTNNFAHYKNFALRARKKVYEEYSSDRMVQNYRQLYNSFAN